MPLSTRTLWKRISRRANRLPAADRRDEEALDEATLANLSSQHISQMTRHELARMVRAARTPASQRRRLEYLDRPTLEQLAYQARLSAQQRIPNMPPPTHADKEQG